MGTSTPVLGLRPIRCALSRSTKVPKPEIFTFCPSDSASDICDRIDSTIIADSLRDSPICWLIRAAISALVSVPAVISSLPLLTRQPKPVPGRPPPSRFPNRCVTKAKKSAKLKWMAGEVDTTSPFPDERATPILDAQHSRATGEAAAHRLQHDKIARFDAPVAYREVERQRHRCRRCIRVLVNRQHHALGRQAQLFRGRVADPLIRLVRDDPVAMPHRHSADGHPSAPPRGKQ